MWLQMTVKLTDMPLVTSYTKAWYNVAINNKNIDPIEELKFPEW